ncbi:MBL fold metallo-hydrolase [Gammaproteobacteria bacterium]|nr:MBL fold metallo-hydrolase [Gammaproteobacteria bacterium]
MFTQLKKINTVISSLFLSFLITFPIASLAQQNFDDIEIQVLHVRGNIYMLVGAGGNITLQAGDQGVLIVDTMYAPLSDKIYSAIRSISNKPLTYIINTHAHSDHIGGNANLAMMGSNIAGGNTIDLFAGTGEQAKIVAHENVVNSILATEEDQLDIEGWPTDTYYTASKDLFFNGEAIMITHQPNAHTDADSLIFFRRSDVISTGDIFRTTAYPFIDVANGGSMQGVLNGLNNILDMAVPADRQEGGTMIIPGHGRLTDEADVLDYRDMLTIIHDRIAYRIDQGDSLAQVLATEPTFDYDDRYGLNSGTFTTEKFIETIYNELSSQ